MDFYPNVYLLREDANRMPEGASAYLLDGFFGDFFVRKCMWSTPSSIKQNIASLKKFYRCMSEKGHVSEQAYRGRLAIVKKDKEDWLDFCARYNDPDADFEGLLLF